MAIQRRCSHQQPTFSGTGFDQYRKKTREEAFPGDMGQIIPRQERVAVIESFYPKPEGAGRRPIGIERMLRIAFCSTGSTSRTRGAEEALYGSRAMRRLAGIDLGRKPAPGRDHDLQVPPSHGGPSTGRSVVQAGECLPGREQSQGTSRHDRGCPHHPGPEFHQEPYEGPGSTDALY